MDDETKKSVQNAGEATDPGYPSPHPTDDQPRTGSSQCRPNEDVLNLSGSIDRAFYLEKWERVLQEAGNALEGEITVPDLATIAKILKVAGRELGLVDIEPEGRISQEDRRGLAFGDEGCGLDEPIRERDWDELVPSKKPPELLPRSVRKVSQASRSRFHADEKGEAEGIPEDET